MKNNDSYSNKSFSATIDGVSDEFEARWRSGAVPSIEDYLGRIPKDQAELRKALLMELVAVDIEYRWSHGENGKPQFDTSAARDALRSGNEQRGPLLDGYVARFPEFPPVAELPLILVCAEYRARKLYGDTPSLADYQERFSAPQEELAAALAKVEAQIRESTASPSHPRSEPSPIDPAATLPTAFSDSTRKPAAADQPPGDALCIRCPNCHEPLEAVPDDLSSDMKCSACGRRVNLSTDDANTYTTPAVKQIAHFELIERLGIGAFGSVWKARDTKLDRAVAIKIPRKDKIEPVEVDRFLHEAKAAAQLRHPNIVSVFEVGRDGDTLFIVSELVRGVNLSDWMTGQRPTPKEAAALCRKIALALHHAHEKGVIHRDLKPGNILIDQEGEPHIADFGLAKRDVGGIRISRDGQVLGTPAYMSPEQAQGEAHRADSCSDIYSLGVILFELVTGGLPFRGNAEMQVHKRITEDAPSPRKDNPDIPRDLDTIVLKCLERQPKNRPNTAAELADVFGMFLKGEPIPWRPIGRIQRGWRWCLRNPAVAALSALVGLLVVALVTVLAVALIKKANELEELRHFEVGSSDEVERKLVPADIELTFGLYESLDWLALEGHFKPFLRELAKDVEKRTGKTVRIDGTIFTDDYEATIQRLADDKLDLVRFGPAPFIQAKQRDPKIQLLAMELEGDNDHHTHPSYIFVHQDSGIEEVSQLREKKNCVRRSSFHKYLFLQIGACEGGNYQPRRGHVSLLSRTFRGHCSGRFQTIRRGTRSVLALQQNG